MQFIPINGKREADHDLAVTDLATGGHSLEYICKVCSATGTGTCTLQFAAKHRSLQTPQHPKLARHEQEVLKAVRA